MRYLGKQYGYYPKDPMEALIVDSLMDLYEDLMNDLYKPHFLPPDAVHERTRQLFETKLPKFLG